MTDKGARKGQGTRDRRTPHHASEAERKRLEAERRTAEAAAPGAERPREVEDRSVGELVRELRDESTQLLRQEVALAKTEIGEKLESYRKHALWLGIGGALLLVAAFALVETLIRGLTVALEDAVGLGTAVWLAPLIVGLLLAGIGYALVNRGSKGMAEEGVVPERTVRSLEEDKEWAQSKTRELKESR